MRPPPLEVSEILLGAREKAREYLEGVRAYVELAQRFAFSEEGLIDALIEEEEVARVLGERIVRECRYIREEAREAWEGFTWTKQFLDRLGGLESRG